MVIYVTLPVIGPSDFLLLSIDILKYPDLSTPPQMLRQAEKMAMRRQDQAGRCSAVTPYIHEYPVIVNLLGVLFRSNLLKRIMSPAIMFDSYEGKAGRSRSDRQFVRAYKACER